MTLKIQTLTICLWAGPGVGKSVTAANLFVQLKLAHLTCELVPEHAKDLVYDGTLKDTPQPAILREQLRRLNRPQGQVEVVVTDAPPAVSQLYATAQELAEVSALLAEAPQLELTFERIPHPSR